MNTIGEHHYLLCTLCVDWPDFKIWADNFIKQRNVFCIFRFFIKLQVHHMFNKLSERLWTKATHHFWRSCHLLLANKESFIVSLQTSLCYRIRCYTKQKHFTSRERTNLIPLPRQTTSEKENQCICKRF